MTEKGIEISNKPISLEGIATKQMKACFVRIFNAFLCHIIFHIALKLQWVLQGDSQISTKGNSN